MGDSACLMQPFSYAAPEGNSVNTLGQSISFGRFLSERVEWEKWTTFSSQNRYVAEAERYSRPGSVAQKKAFFEAHYKKLAAARKAAAEEALLEQQHCAIPGQEALKEEIEARDKAEQRRSEVPGRDSDADKANEGEYGETDEKEKCVKMELEMDSGDKRLLEKSVLKSSTRACEENSRGMSNAKSRVSKLISCEKARVVPKACTFTPAKEINRLASILRKMDGSSRASKPSKECKAPPRTPNTDHSRQLRKNLLSTPLTDNCKGKIAPESSAKVNKTGRGRWNFLPTESRLYSPSCFTPFGLRTEERAARRKKKLEEKFKATEAQEQHLEAATMVNQSPNHEEGTGEKEKSKLRRALCFKARPLPNFYKQRPKSTDQTKKSLIQHQEEKEKTVTGKALHKTSKLSQRC